MDELLPFSFGLDTGQNEFKENEGESFSKEKEPYNTSVCHPLTCCANGRAFYSVANNIESAKTYETNSAASLAKNIDFVRRYNVFL